MTDTTQTSYAESRTGKGDKWFQQIKGLKAQVDNLEHYADAHQNFSRMIEDGLKTLTLDNSREIARSELINFCTGRVGEAQRMIRRILNQIDHLEITGVAE